MSLLSVLVVESDFKRRLQSEVQFFLSVVEHALDLMLGFSLAVGQEGGGLLWGRGERH